MDATEKIPRGNGSSLAFSREAGAPSALPECQHPAPPSLPLLQSIAPSNREGRGNGVIEVSVILPVYNAECWLDECLKSVLEQDFQGSFELSVFNDASTDNSVRIIEHWKVILEDVGIQVVLGGNTSSQPSGVGFAKNQAIDQSSGTYLCFLDSDDVMMPQRIKLQREAAIKHPKSIIGGQIKREPLEATERYTRWINNLTQEQLLTQIFTSHGPTVIMPTWFCSREWFCHVGKFDEGGKGTPEDLLFFYEHLRKGGGVYRVDQCLLLYRYHPQAATHSVLEQLGHKKTQHEPKKHSPEGNDQHFFISQGSSQCIKIYFRVGGVDKISTEIEKVWHKGDHLGTSPANQKKVVAFCDVDKNKIAKRFYTYEDSKEIPKPRIPVLHFRDASPPFIICVKLDLTGGQFEENLNLLELKEGVDYYHFN
ncbi:UDP-GlcNAc:betaGal beta-1,3-N-acetylglucosaminyltransferase-like protein 1 [Anolis carolinensis]|uniref:UDP-GlcNAc:betaGal beta-1,3-N-acetylglucosaminyltransferase-like protein 1 n=1 Tax=Anolis carolinensis TaxID=28377 RepID=UPI002F2B6198